MSEMLASRQDRSGRVNQRTRTRDAILQAGAALLRLGQTPSVVEAAAAARVSQATAYRYFPTQESLLSAVVDREMRSALHVLDRAIAPVGDPEEDIARLAGAIFDETFLREPEHRSLLRLALDQWFMERRGAEPDNAIERGGRIAYVVEALEPLREALGEADFFQLAEAVSLAIGIEAHLVLRDIWHLPKAHAADVVRWTCRALIRQAKAEAARGRSAPLRAANPAAKRALERSRRRRRVAQAENQDNGDRR
jgi:AcrR family transcriptional regulator